MSKVQKKRIILDFSPELMNEIDELKDNLGATSRAEVIRLSLGLLKLTAGKRSEGYSFQFKKDDSIIDVAMPMLG